MIANTQTSQICTEKVENTKQTNVIRLLGTLISRYFAKTDVICLFKSWNSGWELTWKMMPWTNSRYLNFEAYTYLVMHIAAVMWCHSKDTRAFPGQTTRLSSDDCVGTSNKCIIQKSYMPFWLTYIANICMYILNSLVGTLSSCQSRESTTIKYTNLSQTTLFFGFYLSASRFNSTTPTFFFYSYQIEIHLTTYNTYMIYYIMI